MALKYSNEVIINRPIQEVVDLFDNPDNLSKWQPGFQSMEHLDGEYGMPGSTYQLKYKMGKRDVEMIETVLERNLPHQLITTYDAKNVWNKVDSRFESIDDNTTRYITHNEFKMTGGMKIFMWLMPGMFKKQSQKYLDYFKAFVETGKEIE